VDSGVMNSAVNALREINRVLGLNEPQKLQVSGGLTVNELIRKAGIVNER
jgi:hypothetical protein